MRSSLPQFLNLLLLTSYCGVAVWAQTPQYTIRDLGQFSARAINDSSKVAGSRGNSAVLYDNGVITDITPPGGVIAEALGINNFDQIVGRVFMCDMTGDICVNGRTRGFIYDKGTFTVMGTLGGRDSQAFAVNDNGQVTGWSDTSGSATDVSGPSHAFIFKNGIFDDIGTKTNATSTFGASINASAQVAGHAGSNTDSRGAFIYNGAYVFFETRGIAHDLNNGSQVVGRYGGNDDGSGRAFLYSSGVFQDLGSLSLQHTFSEALAINNSGTVVGYSSSDFFSSNDQRAFIYSNGHMVDLNTLIADNPGWLLTSATDVNDAGQIVGEGLLNGQVHAYMLTPTQPMLLTELINGKAIAVQSVMWLRDPFAVSTPHNLSSDTRTRLTILLRNMETFVGETLAPPTVQAEDSTHRIFSLPVEFFGKVPGHSWMTQIIVRLPPELDGIGEVQLFVSFRGRTSNKGSVHLDFATP